MVSPEYIGTKDHRLTVGQEYGDGYVLEFETSGRKNKPAFFPTQFF